MKNNHNACEVICQLIGYNYEQIQEEKILNLKKKEKIVNLKF